MKLTVTSHRGKGIALLATALLIGLPVNTFALFGLGDIVFDPSTFAQTLATATSDAGILTNVINAYNEAVKTYSQITNEYNLAKQMALRITSKSAWLTVATQATAEYTQNKYGETVNWGSVMRGDPLHAATAYGNATTRISPDLDLSGETLGSSYHLANLASIEAMDSASSGCLQSIAQYRSNATANQTAEAALTSSEMDGSDDTNSTVAQLNELNGAAAQARAEAQSQGALQSCIVEQQVLANTVQRNTQVESFNTFAKVNTVYNSNPTMLVGVSTTLTADIN